MNNEIVSSNVIVQKRFSFQKMLEIHQEVKKITGTIYLQHKHKIIDASSLTKLVSFLLTVEPKATIKIIIEGPNAEAILQRFTLLLGNEVVSVKKQQKTQLIESSDSISL